MTLSLCMYSSPLSCLILDDWNGGEYGAPPVPPLPYMEGYSPYGGLVQPITRSHAHFYPPLNPGCRLVIFPAHLLHGKCENETKM